MQEFADSVKLEIQNSFAELKQQLIELARIPGIAWEAFDANQLELSAQAVAKLFAETEVFDTVQILRSSANGKAGAPAVVARRAAKNGKPQILLTPTTMFSHQAISLLGTANLSNR